MMRVDCAGCSPISWRLASSHVPFFVASLSPSSWWKRTPSLYQTSSFHSLVSSILLMCGDAFLLLQACLALSVSLCPFVLSSYFLHSQYVLPFHMALLHMIAILVRLVMGVCDSVERLFILLLSVFLRFEGVMDCLSVASAEVYDRSCMLSFVCRSSSNWVMGCLLLLWRCTYRCLDVTVWRSGARHCESANLRNCKSVSLVCELCCWRIQHCAWFGVRRRVLGVLEVCCNGCISCCLPVAVQYALTWSCECALVCCVREDRWERIERVEVCMKCMMCLCLFLTLILVRAYPIGCTKHLIPLKPQVVAPRCCSRGFDRSLAHASPIRQNTHFTNTYPSASTVCAELPTLRGLWRQSFRKKDGLDVNSQFIRIWRRGWWYNKVLT